MRVLIAILSGLWMTTAYSASLAIPIYAVHQVGPGKSLGTITAIETESGLLFQPKLMGLRSDSRIRGFHVHEGNSCDNFGQAARGHWDPEQTHRHLGPYEATGHLGDMPVLVVNKDGTVTLPVLAPRLTLASLAGHTLVIHADGDNYADAPVPLGGGSDRVACGIIPATAAIGIEDQQVQTLLERKKTLQVLQQKSQEELTRLQEQVHQPTTLPELPSAP